MSFLDDIVNLAANNTTNATTAAGKAQALFEITKESYYVFLYFGPFMMLCILIMLYIYWKVPECRQQPGDLFLMIAIASLL